MSVSGFRYGSRLSASKARSVTSVRLFSLSAPTLEAVQKERPRFTETIPGTRREELELRQQGKSPIGSRRRRRAQYFTTDLPFEQLPYQCFQEARKVLQEDRAEKLAKIIREEERILRAEAKSESDHGGEIKKRTSIASMKKHLEELKVLADVNDPAILKQFEDGLGDMDKPIYRHYADKKWREYKYKLLVQRIQQMHIVPDLVPKLDPKADISISFGKKKVPAGEFVDSSISENAPDLRIQVFNAGKRLVTIAVIDADVPNPSTDSFENHCHFLATNISLAPTKPDVALSALPDANVVFPWLPPYAQKGAPYHRLAVLVFEQKAGKTLDVEKLKVDFQRHGFNPYAMLSKLPVTPMTASLFRTVWDDSMEGVMKRAGLEGADIEFRPKKPEAQHWKYRVKDGERYR